MFVTFRTRFITMVAVIMYEDYVLVAMVPSVFPPEEVMGKEIGLDSNPLM
jgi:hypothetical protein